MPAIESLTSLFLIGTVFFLIPGPAVLYIIARSTEGGIRAGAAASLGMSLAALVHVAAASLGVARLLLAQPELLSGMRVLGAILLAGLGIRALTSSDQRPSPPPREVWHQSFLVNLLNPKAIVFYLAVIPQFVNADRPDVASQTVIVGLLLVGLGLACDLLWAVFAGLSARALGATTSRQGLFRRIGGGLLIALSLLALFTGERTATRAS